jgi:hypothetical protein
MTTGDPLPQADSSAGPTIWLSGEIATFINKLLLPPLWIGLLGGLLIWAYWTYGRIRVAPGFQWLAALIVAATVWMLWFNTLLQRVGYAGRELVVANYRRQARVPFEIVESVEPVWWYRRRLVRIRFRAPTPFGQTVYYLPKWGPIRFRLAAPEEELRRILA